MSQSHVILACISIVLGILSLICAGISIYFNHKVRKICKSIINTSARESPE